MRVRSLICALLASAAAVFCSTATSSASFIVEAQTGGQNNSTNYHETGGWASSSGTVTATGITAGATSRYSGTTSFFGPTRMAVYTYTPAVSGTYDVSLAWPSTAGQTDTLVVIYSGADSGNATPDSFGNTNGPSGVLYSTTLNMYYSGANQWNLVDSLALTAGTQYSVGIYAGHKSTDGLTNRVAAGAAEFSAVPEPASLSLLALAIPAVLGRKRKRA